MASKGRTILWPRCWRLLAIGTNVTGTATCGTWNSPTALCQRDHRFKPTLGAHEPPPPPSPPDFPPTVFEHQYARGHQIIDRGQLEYYGLAADRRRQLYQLLIVSAQHAFVMSLAERQISPLSDAFRQVPKLAPTPKVLKSSLSLKSDRIMRRFSCRRLPP